MKLEYIYYYYRNIKKILIYPDLLQKEAEVMK